MNRKNLNIRIITSTLTGIIRGGQSKSNFIQVKERMKSRWLIGVGVRLTAAREGVEEMHGWLRGPFPKCMMAVSEHMELRSAAISLQSDHTRFLCPVTASL